MMQKVEAEQVAEALFKARSTMQSVPSAGEGTAEEAAQIMNLLVRHLTQEGRKPIAAYKVAAGGAWGVFTADMICGHGAELRHAEFFAPLIEAEVAFTPQEDIDPSMSLEEVLEKSLVAPVLEIPDSRWASWRPPEEPFAAPTPFEMLADNAFAHRLVVGPWSPGRKLQAETVLQLEENGAVIGEAPISNVMEHPANAVLWLAAQLAEKGEKLSAGTVISPGCPIRNLFRVPRETPRTYASNLIGYGAVSVNFA